MSRPESQPFEPVVASLERSDLDPSKCIIHGAAVLALHNLRAVRDIDLFVEPVYLAELADRGQTPSGLALIETPSRVPGRRSLVTDGETGLDPALDMGAYANTGWFKRLLFARHLRLASSQESRIGTLRLLSLREHRDLIASSPRPKHQRDVALIDAYLQSSAASGALAR